MLSELCGMEWWKVHDEAERLEHAVSPDFEAKLMAKLGKSGACPHGNLSEMESPASRRHRGLLLLADAAPGAVYSVSGIYERDRRLLEFLEARGIRPGAKLRLLDRNYDQTLAISTTAGNISLGRAAAQRVSLFVPSAPPVAGGRAGRACHAGGERRPQHALLCCYRRQVRHRFLHSVRCPHVLHGDSRSGDDRTPGRRYSSRTRRTNL